MSKWYQATCKNEDKQIVFIESELYTTKKEFKEDLQRNGYIVKGIYTKEDLKAREYGYTSYLQAKKDGFWNY